MDKSVLHVGPMVPATGGIATVMNNIRATAPVGYHLEFANTYGPSTAAQMVATWRTARRVVEAKPEIVHLHVSRGGSAIRKAIVARAARRRGVPYVCHIHNGDFAGFLATSPGVVRRLTLSMLAHAERVVVLGDVFAESIAAATGLEPARFVVIPNAVPPAPALPRHDSARCQLLFLGQIGTRKGADVLAEALSLVPSEGWHLTAAGDGDAHLFDGLPTERCTVLGWRSREEVAQLLADTDVLVLPSRADGEAMPMAILEAMAASRPVIASAVGAVPEVLPDGHGGFVVPPGDVASLSNCISRLVDDPSLRASMGLQAVQRWRSRYSLTDLELSLAALYDSVRHLHAARTAGT